MNSIKRVRITARLTLQTLHDNATVGMWIILDTLFASVIAGQLVRHYASFYQTQASLGDFLIQGAAARIIGLAVAPMIILLGNRAQNMTLTLNRAIREKSFRAIWLKRNLTSVLICLFASVSFALFLVIQFMLFGSNQISNFTQQSSLFALANNGVVLFSEPAPLMLILVFSAYAFSILIFSSISFNLLNWAGARKWVAFLVVVLFALVNSGPQSFAGLYSMVSISYDSWLEGSYYFSVPLLALIGCALVFPGAALSKRKELFYEE